MCTGKDERLDPHNGLLLTATLDALFDKGLISFEDDGTIVISAQLREEQRPLVLDHQQRKLRTEQLLSEQQQYLNFHRMKVFKR
jgi:predicted restriction endonuclease